MRDTGRKVTGGGRPPGRLLRLLLPFWGDPRASPDVSDGARARRMMDAALRIGIGGLIVWWLLAGN